MSNTPNTRATAEQRAIEALRELVRAVMRQPVGPDWCAGVAKELGEAARALAEYDRAQDAQFSADQRAKYGRFGGGVG